MLNSIMNRPGRFTWIVLVEVTVVRGSAIVRVEVIAAGVVMSRHSQAWLTPTSPKDL